jgi:hypothetical protein
MDHLGGEDLLKGVDVAELGVGVFGGMKVVYACYFCEVIGFGAVSGVDGLSASSSLRKGHRVN